MTHPGHAVAVVNLALGRGLTIKASEEVEGYYCVNVDDHTGH